ncbi:MAG: hypothetical protein KA801_06510 [Syntrophorhabdaceae bacterium]|nr:hypothetical protein [Syntrophorhabdaceae bacterium]
MKEIKKMESELKTVEERIGQIAPERKRLGERFETAKENHSRIESRIAELRNERQEILVAEGDLEDVNARIKETRKSGEILEDEIEGLSRKLASLEVEETRLAAGAKDLRKEIFKEGTIRPLVVEYNRLAPQLAETLKRFHTAMGEYKRTFGSPAQRLIADQEGNIGPRLLPGMWLPGEDPVPDYYDRAVEAEKLTALANERLIKEKYSGCRCFKCANYVGVSPHLTVHCHAIKGEIPREILAGQTPNSREERWAMFYRQCSFTPVS